MDNNTEHKDYARSQMFVLVTDVVIYSGVLYKRLNTSQKGQVFVALNRSQDSSFYRSLLNIPA